MFWSRCCCCLVFCISLTQGLAQEPTPNEPDPASVHLAMQRLHFLREASVKGLRSRHAELTSRPPAKRPGSASVPQAAQWYADIREAHLGLLAGPTAAQAAAQDRLPLPQQPLRAEALWAQDGLALEALVATADRLIDPAALDHPLIPSEVQFKQERERTPQPLPVLHGANLLPIVSHANQPRWAVPIAIRELGPYTCSTAPAWYRDSLPDLVPAPAFTYTHPDAGELQWRKPSTEGGREHKGPSRRYLWASIINPIDQVVVIEVACRGRAALWINDRCEWLASHPPEETAAYYLPLRLSRGRHELLFGSHGRQAELELAICTAGDPVHLAEAGQAERRPAISETGAASVLQSIPRRPTLDAKTIAPDPEAIGRDLPIWRCRNACAPARFLVLGPLPPKQDGSPLIDLVAAAGLRPHAGMGIADPAADSVVFMKLAEHLIPARAQMGIAGLYANLTYRQSAHGRLYDLLGGKSSGELWLYSIIENDRQRLMVTVLKQPAREAWLAGVPVQEGDALRLPPGRFPFLVRLSANRLPPAAARRFVTNMGFVQRQYINEYQQAWVEQVAPQRQALLDIVRSLPGTPTAARARTTLDLLDETIVEQGR